MLCTSNRCQYRWRLNPQSCTYLLYKTVLTNGATSLIPPTDKKLENLFGNTNWGHFLDPHAFEPSGFKGHTRVAATQYQNPKEQQSAVNRIVNVMLGAIPDLARPDFAAFEWAVNELTDNVLVHASSS